MAQRYEIKASGAKKHAPPQHLPPQTSTSAAKITAQTFVSAPSCPDLETKHLVISAKPTIFAPVIINKL
jgi:hypothetical protein